MELSPDIALLQEVGGLPETLLAEYECAARNPASKKRGVQKFRTAVLVRGAIGEPIGLSTRYQWVNEELARFRGNFVAHVVTLRDGPQYRVLSVYSPAWPIPRARLEGVDTAGIKLQHNPDVWVTELLWTSLREQDVKSEPAWAVGGDLNASETFDYMWPGGPRGNRDLLDRLSSLGLTECLREANGRVVPTFRNPRDGKCVHQIDQLFVGPALAQRMRSCVVGDAERIFGDSLSDHLPIIAEFE